MGAARSDDALPSSVVVQMAVTLRDAGAQSSRKVVESPRSTVPFQPAMRLVGADSPSEADVEADVVAEEFYVSEGWRQDVARAQEPMPWCNSPDRIPGSGYPRCTGPR